jgi:8-oxo-dGTP pyrophosphatase MutT (NUDIX family)
MRDKIGESWDRPVQGAKKSIKSPHAQRLCRLVDWHLDGNVLHLAFGPTDVQALLGTSWRSDGGIELWKRDQLSSVTGVCSVVATADHRLIVQRRSDQVIQFPGFLHVCGGMLEQTVMDGTTRVDPFAHMRLELWEELGIRAQNIFEMNCLGVIKDAETLQPEILFVTKLNVTADRFVGAAGPEHKELRIVKNAAEPLKDFLLSNVSQFVPVGFGCLAVFGEREFGHDWFEWVTEAGTNGQTRSCG